MNKFVVNILLLITSGMSFLSCEKVITITPPPYAGKVSIQSMLEPGSLPIVYFNKTVPYFDSKINFADLVIRNANINITTGSATDILKLDSVYDKVYCEYNYYYKGSKPVQLNKAYTLTITNNNDTYTASCSTGSISGSAIDSTSYTANYKDLYGEHEGVIIYFKDVPAQVNYYRYEMDRFIDTATKKAEVKIVSPCLGRDSVQVQELGRSVFSDVGQDGQQLKIVIEPAYSHNPGTKGYIRIQSIDKNAFNFFDQLDKQKLSQFNPFIEPVFLRDGQFGSRAIGYFSAMIKSNPVLFVYPE
ncbi:MAG: DUF4249 family protein [Sphingobacteriales bacterium]|nr:DUF4249 family protein [Sphingobacteriales bacterium]MBI3720462.1 DUF4249 family protein [Sphingobacteriales bacterium]